MPADRPDFLDLFYQECDRCLAELDRALASMREGGDGPDDAGVAFRMVHTISGDAAIVGFDEVAAFARALESFLAELRSGAAPASPEILDAAADAGRVLRTLIEARRHGGEVDPGTIVRAEARLATLSVRPDA